MENLYCYPFISFLYVDSPCIIFCTWHQGIHYQPAPKWTNTHQQANPWNLLPIQLWMNLLIPCRPYSAKVVGTLHNYLLWLPTPAPPFPSSLLCEKNTTMQSSHVHSTIVDKDKLRLMLSSTKVHGAHTLYCWISIMMVNIDLSTKSIRSFMGSIHFNEVDPCKIVFIHLIT